MLIDSHCHLPGKIEEAEKLIKSAEENDVVAFINIGTSIKENLKAIKTANYFKNVFATVAIYPHEDMGSSIESLQQHLEEALTKEKAKIVAIGECGADISNWEGGRNISDQLELFEMQIKLALKYDLPLVIHNRNADDQVISLLKKYKSADLKGVAHCFASSWEVAQKYLDMNFFISFSGMVTYPSRKELLTTIVNVPNDMFLVETDAPYLPPQGFRGQPNEPKNVKIVAQYIAEIKKESFESISKLAYDNTRRVFKLPRI
jgi:TatD DNase family protein